MSPVLAELEMAKLACEVPNDGSSDVANVYDVVMDNIYVIIYRSEALYGEVLCEANAAISSTCRSPRSGGGFFPQM